MHILWTCPAATPPARCSRALLALAVLSRLVKTLQDYVTRLVVQKFGTQSSTMGLRQTLRSQPST